MSKETDREETWQRALAGAIRGSKEESPFPFLVTREFASRVRTQELSDPLWRQVAIQDSESASADGFVLDAVGDEASQVLPGLLHKYQGRVLMVLTGACAIHCRYCFRRHYPYSEVPKATRDWQPAMDYIANDSTVREVILSGGDPLTVTDDKLAWLAQQLAAIPHVQTLRIHSRLPVVLPSRIDGAMIDWLTATRLQVHMVIHANHAQELDVSVGAGIARLRQAGILVFNQAVLLAGVNDTVESLEGLSLRLLQMGVVPYYLNQLDRVAGAAHFEVPVEKGLQLMAALRERLPGYAVPRYVQDLGGGKHKVEVGEGRL